jgi:hypothetical protein
MPRLLDCGTSGATRGSPVRDPTVPIECNDHGSVSRGERRDGRYDQRWTDSNCSSRRAEAAVQSPTGSHPLLKRQGTPSHGVKTTRPCSVPRMARACSTDAPRIAHPAALTPWQGRRHLRQEKRAPFRLRHNDRVKKGAPPYLNSCPFSFPLSLSCHRDRERGIFRKRILPSEGNGP